MFAISSGAMTELALVLAESASTDGEPVMRMEAVDGELCLRPGLRRPEDVVFTLDGPGSLCVGRGLVAELGERTLEFSESADGTRFCVVD